jgi:hypothetical protein
METIARIVSDAVLGEPYAIAFVFLSVLAVVGVAIFAWIFIKYRRFL